MNELDVVASELLQSLTKLKIADRKVHQLMASSNPSIGPLMTIDHLSLENEVTIKDIKDALQISHSAATQIVNTLEEAGYISKLSSQKDKRSVVVEFTTHGREVLRNTREYMREHMINLIEFLGVEDAKELTRITEKMIDYCQMKRG